MNFVKVILITIFISSASSAQNLVDCYFPIVTGNQWIKPFMDCHYLCLTIFENIDSTLFKFGEGLTAPLCDGHHEEVGYTFSYFEIEYPNKVWYAQYFPKLNISDRIGLKVDFTDSSNIISFDSTVIVPAGTFEHCYVFSNGDIYAPNVGPIKDLVYAKVNGVEYGTYPSELTSVEIAKEHPPTDFSLFQNYPNPFNSSTVIDFTIPEAAGIKLTVFDVTGKEVKTILNSRLLAGSHSARWDGADDFGRTVASGIYLIRLQAGQYSKTIKAIYTR